MFATKKESDCILDVEIQKSSPKELYLSKEQEFVLIAELQTTYQEVLNRLGQSPGIITSLKHLCRCVNDHNVSLSLVINRGDRSVAELKSDFISLQEDLDNFFEKLQISDVVDSSSRYSFNSYRSNGDFSETAETSLLLEAEGQELFRKFNLSTAAVDYIAPYYLRNNGDLHGTSHDFMAIRKAYDRITELRDKLFDNNEGLVVADVKRRAPGVVFSENGSWNFEDLAQSARTALFIAIHRFDPSLGVKFSTFASQWIGAAVYDDCYEKMSVIRVPRWAQRELSSFEKKGVSLDELLTDEECQRTSLDLLAQAQRVLSVGSLDSPLQTSDMKQAVFADTIPAREENISYQLDEVQLSSSRRDSIKSAFERLSEREISILNARYGLDGEPVMKLIDIAAKCGISGTRVAQIEKGALKKLGQFLAGQEEKLIP